MRKSTHCSWRPARRLCTPVDSGATYGSFRLLSSARSSGRSLDRDPEHSGLQASDVLFSRDLCLDMRSQRGGHAEPREVLLGVVQAEDVEVVVVVVFALRLSSGGGCWWK